MIKISYDKEGDVLEIIFSESAISDSEYVDKIIGTATILLKNRT